MFYAIDEFNDNVRYTRDHATIDYTCRVCRYNCLSDYIPDVCPRCGIQFKNDAKTGAK